MITTTVAGRLEACLKDARQAFVGGNRDRINEAFVTLMGIASIAIIELNEPVKPVKPIEPTALIKQWARKERPFDSPARGYRASGEAGWYSDGVIAGFEEAARELTDWWRANNG